MTHLSHDMKSHDAIAEVEAPRVILGDAPAEEAATTAPSGPAATTEIVKIVPNSLLVSRIFAAQELRQIVALLARPGKPALMTPLRQLLAGVNIGSLGPLLDRLEHLRSVGSDRRAFVLAALPLLRTWLGAQTANADFELRDRLQFLLHQGGPALAAIQELVADDAPVSNIEKQVVEMPLTPAQRQAFQATNFNWPVVLAIVQSIKILFAAMHGGGQ